MSGCPFFASVGRGRVTAGYTGSGSRKRRHGAVYNEASRKEFTYPTMRSSVQRYPTPPPTLQPSVVVQTPSACPRDKRIGSHSIRAATAQILVVIVSSTGLRQWPLHVIPRRAIPAIVLIHESHMTSVLCHCQLRLGSLGDDTDGDIGSIIYLGSLVETNGLGEKTGKERKRQGGIDHESGGQTYATVR